MPSMLALLALLIGAEPTPADVALLRVEATAAYHAKRYAEACPKFAEAARLAPDDAAIAADLGRCLDRLGNRGEAIAETRRAIALARPGAREAERVRSGAYRDLALLGAALPVPALDACGPLPAVPGCTAGLHACTRRVPISGKGGGAEYGFLVVGRTTEDAEEQDVRIPSYLDDEEAPAPAYWRPRPVVTVPLDAQEQVADPSPGHVPAHARCTLVWADACAGLVASVCEDVNAKPPRRFVHELPVAR
jgi:hypothetical protein